MSDFRNLMEMAATELSDGIPDSWDREVVDARALEVLNLALTSLVTGLSAKTKFALVDCVDASLRELGGLADALRGEIRRIPAPEAPEGHRWFVEVPRSRREVAEATRTGETAEAARTRLGPRLRCECGRGLGSRIALADHHRDPLRDERWSVDAAGGRLRD